MAPTSRTSSGNSSSSRKRQFGPGSSGNNDADFKNRMMQRARFADPIPAPLSDGASLGDLSHLRLSSPMTGLPFHTRRKPADNKDSMIVDTTSNAEDDEVSCLSPSTILDLFGPEPGTETSSDLSAEISPAPMQYRPRRKMETPVGFWPTTNDRYINPRPCDAVRGSATPLISPRVPYTADSERVRRPSRSSSGPPGNVFGGSGPSRGRSTIRSASDGATPARSRSRSQSRSGRPSLYEQFATPGAHSPFFKGTAMSIMTPDPRSDSARMPPPARPSAPRSSSTSRRPSMSSTSRPSCP
ncbi:hypothetical protein SEUCBS139899_002198 [Sporothrix eucalyptigena]